jgi:ribA/ribD-fused uncharacterized protein
MSGNRAMSSSVEPPAIPKRCGPWSEPEALRFYGGQLSNFAPTPGLWLPAGWSGHPRPAPRVEVPTIEHYFQACKARNLADFEWVLSAPSPQSAKRRGGPTGEAIPAGGRRRIDLRPDWEEVKLDVMRVGNRAKFALPRFRPVLLATGNRVIVENSPSDDIWGGRDKRGGFEGLNLLGIVLMEVRAEIVAGDAA